MTEFFDTSVMFAACWDQHVKHRESLRVVARANKRRSCCGLHSLAELYSTLTALPVKQPLLPEQVILFVDQMRDRMRLITLDEAEYLETISQLSERGIAGGRVYDALLLRCAAKSRAKVIYTWNLRHFCAIAPALAPRIRTP